ncbi:hypothetical protein [Acinetobacter sp. NCu2D-2]|nr:hypothetical protein [Acinetobacter sp. NCu2D-2]
MGGLPFFYAEYYRKGENYNWSELNPDLDDECSHFNAVAAEAIDKIISK